MARAINTFERIACWLTWTILAFSSPSYAEHTQDLREASREAETWVLAGQSNMVGEAPIPADEAVDLASDPDILMFNLDNTWQIAAEPLHRHYEATAPIFRNLYHKTPDEWSKLADLSRHRDAFYFGRTGPGMFFAKHLIGHLNHPILLIPCAFGGLPIEKWDPALIDQGGESLYGAMIERIRMGGGKLRGVLWYQGESDALDSRRAEQYEKAFLHLVDALRKDTGIKDLPFIYVQLASFAIYESNDQPAKSIEVVREAQRRAAAQRDNVFMTSAIDLPLYDHAHLSYEGQKRLGHRMAEIALSKIYRQPEHAQPIELASVEIVTLDSSESANSSVRQGLRVRFDGVHGCLQAAGRPSGFELRNGANAMLSPPIIYRIGLETTSCLLHLNRPLSEPAVLYYGPGLTPYANICDDLDSPLPAFGPVDVTSGSQ
jgi:sialate O-acetylesterase